jgi:sugar phosphate isomerase/epimerase
MMPAPVALQLYSVREYAQEDFEASVRRVAEIGYAGVEPAGFPGTTPEKAGQLFADLGLEVPSAHVALPLGDQQDEVISTMDAIGCSTIVSGKGPDDFATPSRIKATCDLFNEANQVARSHGMTFGLHNHWWEYTKVEGRYVYEAMLEYLDPTIHFEIDTYWVQTAGVDPAKIVEQLGERAPLLHIKDGPCVKDEPMTAVGDGVVDVPAVVAAGKPVTEWLIVELDRCATDMMEAVARSYSYLVGEGLAQGRG